MNAIKELTEIDYISFVLVLFSILFGVKEIIELLNYFRNKLGLKTKISEEKNKTEIRLATLEKHDNWQYKEIEKISNCVETISANLIEKEIEDMRWELIDFSSALAGGRYYNKEAFEHIFRIYEKYEDTLNKRKMTNGYIDESMAAIREVYKQRLLNNELK